METTNDILISDFFLQEENSPAKNILKHTSKKLNLLSFRELLNEKNLKFFDPAYGDKILRYFWNNDNKKMLRLFWFLLIWLTIIIMLSIFEGNFLNKNIMMDLFHSVGFWNGVLLALPATYLISNRYFKRLPFILFNLAVDGSIKITIDDWNHFIIKTENIYKWKIIRFTPTLITIYSAIAQIIVYNLGVYPTSVSKSSWLNNPSSNWGTISGWVNLPLNFILTYLMTAFIIRLIATSYILKNLFSNHIYVKIFHPDGCGGLSMLGKLSQSMNMGIFLFGISIVLTFYHRTIFYQINLFDLSNILYAVLYIASSASVFFLPLYFVHVKMKEEKYKTLEIISDNYERIERKETPMFFELNNEFI